jgi:hypothetical protein
MSEVSDPALQPQDTETLPDSAAALSPGLVTTNG